MKKIMIVDDNYLSAEGIEKNIDWETLNAEIIHVCYNGTSAIEAMKKEPADLIISDIEVKTTRLAGGLLCPYKGLFPACARKAH